LLLLTASIGWLAAAGQHFFDNQIASIFMQRCITAISRRASLATACEPEKQWYPMVLTW
jgi:hypothetical protein